MSSTIPSAILRAGGWKPWATSGARRSWIRCGATRCILFHTELGIMSGPGADDGEDWARALPTSSAARAGQSVNGSRMESTGLSGSPGKKWLRRALLSSTGVTAPGSSGKRGGGRPTANFFAVQIVCGVAVARKAAQWSLFGFLNGFEVGRPGSPCRRKEGCIEPLYLRGVESGVISSPELREEI